MITIIKQSLALAVTLITPLSCIAEDLNPPSVRLPAIYHVWGDSLADKPSITIEEIEKCMGEDNTLRQEDERFKVEAKSMNEETAKAESLVKDNQAARLVLDNEASAIQAEKLLMDNRFGEIDRKKAEFAAMTTKKVDAATAKKLNAQIDQLNKDIKQQNANALVLNERIRQFQQKQTLFNNDLTVLKSKLEKVNENTQQFNVRQKAFNDKVLAFRSQCEGERRLEK